MSNERKTEEGRLEELQTQTHGLRGDPDSAERVMAGLKRGGQREPSAMDSPPELSPIPLLVIVALVAALAVIGIYSSYGSAL